MNVTGVSGAAITATVPAPGRPVTDAGSPARQATDDGAAAAAARQAAHQAAQRAQEQQFEQKLPPLKPLSTTEMRVILGAIPPSQLNRRSETGQPGGTLDTYA